MENTEYWINDGKVLIEISSNNRIGVTLFYGSARQYSIKTSADIEQNRDKQIKSLLKLLREEKKNVTPLHGCTNYC